jgi:succinyl-diaminopimelate desuccinylase
MDKTVKLSTDLIKFASITPKDAGVTDFVRKWLENYGFEVEIKQFHKNTPNSEPTLNLYASYGGGGGKNLCFAGHLDVVHPGKEYKWTYPPFEPTVENGVLYGRGAVDMKCAIAAFMVAAGEYVCENADFKNSGNQISLLLTGDEEGNAINGTKPMLEYLTQKGVKIDDCIVGEPTNPQNLGEMVKIGRRGSVSFDLEIEGKQGHIAYPQNFTNPVSLLANCISALKSHEFDNGNEHFDPTNLEVTVISCDNQTINIVPHSASCKFNIRFCSVQTKETLYTAVKNIIESVINCEPNAKYALKMHYSGDAFLCNSERLTTIMSGSIEQITGIKPSLSTTGGTSDARFIKDYANVIEFGLINTTAHQIDENAQVEDIVTLKNIYKNFITHWFDTDKFKMG